MELESGTVIGGRYKLERLLARGGMGSVWTAEHAKLDSRVAIKFMDPELTGSAEARNRFEREAKAAAKLRSPHVVQVLDYGLEEDTPYIVMELLEGEDLRTRLKARARLGLDEAAVILKQACKALRLAADAGIVHRDLKPGNIFLARSGDDQVVKILDFGVAKAVRAAIGDGTSTGVLLGSPHYMSPEQARGGELDPRSDLFSMGVILFQMVTGERPFQGKDVGDVIVKICTEPLPVASQLRPDLPPEVDQFFERALARNRAKRFQSARAMAAEFSTIAAGHLGLALPESSESGSTRLPRVAIPEVDSGSLEPGVTPPPLGSTPEPDPSELPTTTTPAKAVQPLLSPVDAAAEESSGTLRSQVKPRADAHGSPGALEARAEGIAESRPRSRLTAVWAAVAAAVVAGGLVYVLVGSGAAGDTDLEEGPAASGVEVVPSEPAEFESASEESNASTEPPPVASASASASATATASASAAARPPRPPAPKPVWSPKPKRPPAKPKDDSSKGKHPVFGI